MPNVVPGRFVRFRGKGDLSALACPPYDVIDDTQRAALLAADPHNYVRLVLPEGSTDAERYAAARGLLERWMQDGVFAKDDEPSILAMQQRFTDPVTGERRVRRGVFTMLQLSEFAEGKVLPHERTLSGPKADRLALLEATRAHLSPIFVLFPDPANDVNAALERAVARAPDAHALLAGAEHLAWRVTDPATVSAVQSLLSSRTGYIADGHHRYETALKFRALAKAAGRAVEGTPLDHIPAFLCGMSDPGLRILPTHRLLHALPDGALDGLAARASRWFDVTRLPGRPAFPELVTRLAEKDGRAFVFVNRALEADLWSLKSDAPLEEVPSLSTVPALRTLDVALLHAVVFEHLLGLSRVSQERQENLRYEKDGVKALARVASGEAQAAILMHPTKMDEVRAVAEAGEVMPQKSTFFYPKVLDGFALQLLDD